MTELYPMARICADQRHAALIEALADWQDTTGIARMQRRVYARHLLRAARRERDAGRAAFQRTVTASRLRKSAANMRLIASQWDWLADAATDQREMIAYDLAMSAVDDAAAALENGADALDGTRQEETAHAA